MMVCSLRGCFPQNKFANQLMILLEEGLNVRLLQSLRKKYSRQKELRVNKQQRCSLCLKSSIANPLQHLPLNNLKKKYYFPQIETYHYRAANNLIYDPYSRQSVEIVESQKLISSQEMLQKSFSFAETVQTIQSAILRRVQKDFYGWIDFQDHFTITNAYYIRRKHLTQNNKKMQKYLKSTVSMQSTGSSDDRNVREYFQKKLRKELDNQRLVKMGENDTNSSTIEMQKLTRNLQAMIQKIADLSVIRPMHTHNKLALHGRGKQTNNISMLFKINSCGDISAIDKNKEDLITPSGFNDTNNYQESYGLDTIKPKHHGKGKKINKLSLRSMDKINGFQEKLPPETPKPRFFQPGNEYQEIQLNKPGNWNKVNRYSKQKRLAVPMSPGNNRSSSLRQNKTLSRSSQSSSKKGK